MILFILVTFIDLFVPLFCMLIFARVLLGYVVSPENRLYGWLLTVTEPLLVPVRKVLPQSPMLDFSPLVTLFLLQGFQALVHSLLR